MTPLRGDQRGISSLSCRSDEELPPDEAAAESQRHFRKTVRSHVEALAEHAQILSVASMSPAKETNTPALIHSAT